MDLAVGRDGARLHLAHVVEQGRPAHLDARRRLPDDLLRVLPDVLVPPLAVAEPHHGVHFGENRRQRSRLQQLVEAALGVVAHHHAVEARAHPADVQLRGSAEVVDGYRRHRGGRGLALRRERRRFERVEHPVDLDPRMAALRTFDLVGSLRHGGSAFSMWSHGMLGPPASRLRPPASACLPSRLLQHTRDRLNIFGRLARRECALAFDAL